MSDRTVITACVAGGFSKEILQIGKQQVYHHTDGYCEEVSGYDLTKLRNIGVSMKINFKELLKDGVEDIIITVY